MADKKHGTLFSSQTLLALAVVVFIVFQAVRTSYSNQEEYRDLTSYWKEHRAIHCEDGLFQIWDVNSTPAHHYSITDSQGKPMGCVDLEIKPKK